MPRYGDFDKLFNERPEYLNPQHEANGEYNRGWNACNEHYSKLIRNAPTADVAPVVHGRWKYYHKQNIAVCTICSFERDLDANFGKAVSCPNCGAKMDGERRNDG